VSGAPSGTGAGAISVMNGSPTIDFGNANGSENLFCVSGTDVSNGGSTTVDASNNCFDALAPVVSGSVTTTGAKLVSDSSCVATMTATFGSGAGTCSF
jgi:hypothetical protein